MPMAGTVSPVDGIVFVNWASCARAMPGARAAAPVKASSLRRLMAIR